MNDSLLNILHTPVGLGVLLTMIFAILAPFVYLIIRCVCSLSAAGRWKLVKILLTILFLPLVFAWLFATAGSDCDCCCDEDD